MTLGVWDPVNPPPLKSKATSLKKWSLKQMGEELRKGLGFWFCLFATQLYFKNISSQKVNKK